MDIIDKARELGAMIASCDKMKDLKQYEAEMEADQKAMTLMNDYKHLQVELVRATKEKKDARIITGIKERLLEKQKEINEYSITYNFLKAKMDFDNFMKTVNNVIIYSITGEEGCSSDKCGSCGGGCE